MPAIQQLYSSREHEHEHFQLKFRKFEVSTEPVKFHNLSPEQVR